MNAAVQNTRGRTVGDWLSTLPIFIMLLLTLLIGVGELVHGQMIKLGETMFHDTAAGVQYFMLRGDPSAPTCNPHPDVDVEIKKLQQDQKAAPSDAVDALFSNQTLDVGALRQSILSEASVCQQRHDMYQKIVAHITPGVKAFRGVEIGLVKLTTFGNDSRLLLFLIMLGIAMVPTSLGYHHICVRPPVYARDYHYQSIGSCIAFGLICYSSTRYYQISANAGIKIEHPIIFYYWIFLTGVLFLLELVRSFAPRLSPIVRQAPQGGSPAKALESLPFFAALAMVGSAYFLTHNHPSGLAIYINKVQDQLFIHLQLGLYIWTGMLLKQSRLADLVLDVFRPWKFSPEMLTYIILLVAALPTAYTGGSGIFVIAAGSIIYHEIRAVGGTRQFALAATAMSGSLGVVLRPCLLVVLITAMNKEVTSNSLYHWGFYVFLLTSSLFFIVSQLHRTQKVAIQRPSIALPQMMTALVPLIPYVLTVAGVVVFYQWVLGQKMDETNAPYVIPVILISIVCLDKFIQRRERIRAQKSQQNIAPTTSLTHAMRESTAETVGHIGAFNTVILLSLAIAGVVERAEVMNLAPQHFPDVWVCMAFLMVTKVILGMFMDPYGAVILVSSTLAPIAYHNGIQPVHFWMMVLVAFELGYLMPPIALNQLLTRRVIGEDEVSLADREVAKLNFYRRYERWLLPTLVMATSLVVVAFGPLAVQQFSVFAPLRAFFAW